MNFGMNFDMNIGQPQQQSSNNDNQPLQDYKNMTNAGMGGIMAMSRLAAEEEARNGNPNALAEQQMFEQFSTGALQAQHSFLDNNK
jgi:hypothetical protein